MKIGVLDSRFGKLWAVTSNVPLLFPGGLGVPFEDVFLFGLNAHPEGSIIDSSLLKRCLKTSTENKSGLEKVHLDTC